MKNYEVTIIAGSSTVTFNIKADRIVYEEPGICFYTRTGDGLVLVGKVIDQPGLFVREAQ